MKLLLYCTKKKPYLYKNTTMLGENIFTFEPFIKNKDDILNGKIIGECDYEIEDMFEIPWEFGYVTTSRDDYENIEKECCLSYEDLTRYLGKIGNAIYIKNLHIFDKPRRLKEFKQKGEYQCSKSKCPYFDTEKCHYAGECLYEKIIEKAPQNMMYVFDGDEKKVLISIRPEHLCKILNGEKTIEVRKTILKYM